MKRHANKKTNDLILHRLTGMLIRRLLRFFGIFLEPCLLDSITVLPMFLYAKVAATKLIPAVDKKPKIKYLSCTET